MLWRLSTILCRANVAGFKGPIVRPKGPTINKNLLTIADAAKRLQLSEDMIRRQLNNPKAMNLSPEDVRTISVINELPPELMEMQGNKVKKSPVVTVMGHVDHGKTTLIDFLRRSKIAEGQVGGITQKIGAFHIKCHDQKITFIDTPGHEAFKSMRKRGAHVTDLIVLIISAVEGIQKQTEEIVRLIKEENIRTIIAINKLDLPQADPEMVEAQLAKLQLSIEPNGGDIPVVHISAKNGTNINLLTELILEETKDISVVQSHTSEATVLQAYQNSQNLNCITAIIHRGCLKKGSVIVIGQSVFKVKKMQDDSFQDMDVAYPGDAVQIIGINEIPNAGETIFEAQSEAKAKFIVQKRNQMQREKAKIVDNANQVQNSKISKIKMTRKEKRAFCRGYSNIIFDKFTQAEELIKTRLTQLRAKPQNDDIELLIMEEENKLEAHNRYVEQYLLSAKDKPHVLNLIFKFPDRGIQETILEQYEIIKPQILARTKMELNLISSGIGSLSASEIEAASLSNAQVVTFNVPVLHDAMQAIHKSKVRHRSYQLIHQFLKALQQAAIEFKKANISGIYRGKGDICEVFSLKKGKDRSFFAAGVRVVEGKIKSDYKFYVFKNGVPMSDPLKADVIKVFKKEASEVKKGDECTITLTEQKAGLFEKGDQFWVYED